MARFNKIGEQGQDVDGKPEGIEYPAHGACGPARFVFQIKMNCSAAGMLNQPIHEARVKKLYSNPMEARTYMTAPHRAKPAR